MSPDICLNAIEPNKAADIIYSAEFKNGHLEGDNFANSTALFINKQPKKCPINLCVINQENCFDPEMSGLVKASGVIDSKIMFYANTTNGPEYSKKVCI